MTIPADSAPHPSHFHPDSRAAWARLGTALIIGSLGSVGMWSVVVVITAVQAEFGATRAAASLAFTCAMLGFGAGGVGMGKVSDRFGIVPAIGIGTVALAVGYIGAGYSTALWQFNAMHFAVGLGAAATFGPLMAEASHWFEKYRGLAVTIAASGNYVAGTFWPTIVERGTAYAGWRTTHIVIGIGCSLLMVVVVAILRWQIGDEKIRSHENAPPPQVDLRLSTNSLTALLGIASIGCCVAMAMPQVHIVAYCGDLGYGVARGAEMLSLMLAFGIISRIGSGFLADRIGGLRTLLVGSLAQGVALLFYVFFDSLTSLYIISAMFGLFQGGIVPSYAIIVRESMPAREAGTRVGIVIFASVIGMSFGGWVSGLIFDSTGSYAAAFINGLAWNAVNLTIVISLLLRARRRMVLTPQT
ncbi:MFS transporter [Afipia sp. Root123D2]|uniref:MFS transporter n=1 Tax=Afipia sp. Root123D2 TaxID=1736436 RepID=UPI0012E81375|nr:MFS transporter [Afipia sp. Root123D2]